MASKENKIDLSELPTIGRYINWKNSENYKIQGKYNDMKFEIEIIKYKDNSKLIIKYKNKEFEVSTNQLKGCKLGSVLGIRTGDFKIKIDDTFKDNKRDIIITDREYRTVIKKNGSKECEKWYKYTCNICGWNEGWAKESVILKNGGCACCNGKVAVEGINSIVDTDPWMIKYFQGGYDEAKLYTSQSGKKIYAICPDCGMIKDKPMIISNIYKYHSMCCPSCDDKLSYPNKIMFNLLFQIDIDFYTEKSFIWCKYLFKNKTRIGRYDFYFKVNNQEYVIEMDGRQHEEDIPLGNWNSYKEQKFIDEQKEKLAKIHNIRIIRINSKKSELYFIKQNIMNSELNKLFNLANIDWEKAEDFACSNLIKKVCEYKRNHQELGCGEIGKVFKLDRSTIRKYLKKGNIHKWCYYNPDEHNNNNKKQIKLHKKN